MKNLPTLSFLTSLLSQKKNTSPSISPLKSRNCQRVSHPSCSLLFSKLLPYAIPHTRDTSMYPQTIAAAPEAEAIAIFHHKKRKKEKRKKRSLRKKNPRITRNRRTNHRVSTSHHERKLKNQNSLSPRHISSHPRFDPPESRKRGATSA